MSRQSDYMTEVRQLAKQLTDAILGLEAKQSEYNWLAYGDAPAEGQPANLPDGVGDNAGITRGEIGAVVFDTANAMRAVLNAGHGTNLAKLL